MGLGSRYGACLASWKSPATAAYCRLTDLAFSSLQAILKGVGRTDLYRSTSKGQRLDSSAAQWGAEDFCTCQWEEGWRLLTRCEGSSCCTGSCLNGCLLHVSCQVQLVSACPYRATYATRKDIQTWRRKIAMILSDFCGNIALHAQVIKGCCV